MIVYRSNYSYLREVIMNSTPKDRLLVQMYIICQILNNKVETNILNNSMITKHK
jgi:hypothetical protein